MAALIATSLLLALASASREIYFVNTTSEAKFDEYIATANASTVRAIQLPNIHTNTYPSKDQNASWKAWLWTTEERARGGIIYAGLHPDEQYILANGSVQADDQNSWLTCMRLTRFRHPAAGSIPPDQSIQSDCSNVFPADCLQYLHEIAKDGRMCHNSTTTTTLTPSHEKWDESPCQGVLNGEHTPQVLEPDGFFRVTHLDDLQTATSVLGENGSPDGRYDALVNSVYMLAVGFARAKKRQTSSSETSFSDSDTTIDMDAETVPSSFICMRADRFSQGSRTLADISNAGVRRRAALPLLGLTFVIGMGAYVAGLNGGIL